MPSPKPIHPVDYLVIGHITKDLTPTRSTIGGTAAYSARTANALGCRVGIVTAYAGNIESDLLEGVEIYNIGGERSTTFSNLSTPVGRIQTVHETAPMIKYHNIPEIWRTAPIVHLGPVLQEIDYDIVRSFPDSNLFITPQGWYRSWDENGLVSFTEWPEAKFVLDKCTAAVLSIEDLNHNEKYVEQLAQGIEILVITKGYKGAELYIDGFKNHYHVEPLVEVDSTGAGDIFATAFFIHYTQNKDLNEAVKFALKIATDSVKRAGLEGAPSKNDLFQNLT
jgi:sugar/nucleoside kinase (ribokinase family)